MVMDINAPSPQRYSNTRIGVSRCPNNQISKEKSDRESKIPEISKHVIFCTEKRFNRGKMGCRSITTQRLHSVPKIPHAHNARSETPAAQTFWTVSLDLKDGFWHVPISRRKRPYLGFKYKGQYWRFRAMPFGLNIAPRIFTKLMAHVIKIMASEGIFVLIYLDDLLIIAPSEEKCSEHRDRAIAILEELGWIINTEKSRQQPSQIFDWLGVHLDLQTHTVSATQNSMDEFKNQLDLLIKSSSTTKRSIMRLQGLANWIGQSNQIARMFVARTKVLLRIFRYQALGAKLTLSKGMKLSLVKWVQTPKISQQLGNPPPTIIIQTDASLKGWGFQIDQPPFRGEFDQSMSKYSINTLELLTIWFALLKVTKVNQVIQILCDN